MATAHPKLDVPQIFQMASQETHNIRLSVFFERMLTIQKILVFASNKRKEKVGVRLIA
jgi:hypothetical protein